MEADKALQSNPNNPAIRLWFPMYHLANGDYQQAIQQMKQILTRWPLFGPTRVYLAAALREQGDTPGAIRAMEPILEMDPDSPFPNWATARAYMDSGDFPKARQAMERVPALHRPNYQGRLHWALLFALEAKKTEALREMDEQTLTYAGASYLGPLQPAEVYSVLGDTAKALEWLDRAVRWGDEREELRAIRIWRAYEPSALPAGAGLGRLPTQAKVRCSSPESLTFDVNRHWMPVQITLQTITALPSTTDYARQTPFASSCLRMTVPGMDRDWGSIHRARRETESADLSFSRTNIGFVSAEPPRRPSGNLVRIIRSPAISFP